MIIEIYLIYIGAISLWWIDMSPSDSDIISYSGTAMVFWILYPTNDRSPVASTCSAVLCCYCCSPFPAPWL